MTTELADIYKAMEARQLAAFEALGLVLAMVEFDSIPKQHKAAAQVIVDKANAADKVLAES